MCITLNTYKNKRIEFKILDVHYPLEDIICQNIEYVKNLISTIIKYFSIFRFALSHSVFKNCFGISIIQEKVKKFDLLLCEWEYYKNRNKMDDII